MEALPICTALFGVMSSPGLSGEEIDPPGSVVSTGVVDDVESVELVPGSSVGSSSS